LKFAPKRAREALTPVFDIVQKSRNVLLQYIQNKIAKSTLEMTETVIGKVNISCGSIHFTSSIYFAKSL